MIEDIRGSVRDHPFNKRKNARQFNKADIVNIEKCGSGQKLALVKMQTSASTPAIQT